MRSQLKFFEQLERIEKQRKDEQEREILLKAAKVSPSLLLVIKAYIPFSYNHTVNEVFSHSILIFSPI